MTEADVRGPLTGNVKLLGNTGNFTGRLRGGCRGGTSKELPRVR